MAKINCRSRACKNSNSQKRISTMETQNHFDTDATARAAILTRDRQRVYSASRGVTADSPPSLRRLASKFCFYSVFTE
jgi:hypothetical protein